MKKYLDLILVGVGAFCSALILILMSAPGISASVFGATVTESLYGLLDDGVGLIFAMIFVILALVAALCLIALKLLNKKLGYEALIGLCAAVLSLVAGILYFCTKPIVGAGSGINLGVGAIFCGIFGLIGAGAFGYYAFTKKK